MISKLSRWVWAGAWALAFIAGIINVVGLLGFEHQAVTHLTGTTSMLAAALAAFDGAAALHFAAIIGSFVAGTVLSGFLIQDSTLQLGRRYGVALLLESLLLCAAVPLLYRNHSFGVYSASCACGLQNAMVSTYSGAVAAPSAVLSHYFGLSLRRHSGRVCFPSSQLFCAFHPGWPYCHHSSRVWLLRSLKEGPMRL